MTLSDCAKHLIRLRPSYGSRKRRYISSLAQQCEHYRPGNVHLAQQMMETMERIEFGDNDQRRKASHLSGNLTAEIGR